MKKVKVNATADATATRITSTKSTTELVNITTNITDDNVNIIVEGLECYSKKPNTINVFISYYIINIEKNGECEVLLELPSNFYAYYSKECDRYNRGDESGYILKEVYKTEILNKIRTIEE